MYNQVDKFQLSVECIRRLCKSADVIALQETWLLPHDLGMLDTIDVNFTATSKSAVDTSAGILRGRPYGGVAILWRKNLFPK
ncbi:reverse transcriptase, partial [Operophtera brumata]